MDAPVQADIDAQRKVVDRAIVSAVLDILVERSDDKRAQLSAAETASLQERYGGALNILVVRVREKALGDACEAIEDLD